MRGCPFGHRALITLGEKGIPFEKVVFERGKRPAELEALSPRAKSPTLVDGDVALFDSQVILEYLEESHPEPRLMPTAPKDRAHVRTLAARVGEELVPKLYALTMIGLKQRAGTPVGPSELDDAKRAAVEALGPWDRSLEGRTFLVGDALTLADIVLYSIFPGPEFLTGFAIPEDQRHLRAWRGRIGARPTTAPA